MSLADVMRSLNQVNLVNISNFILILSLFFSLSATFEHSMLKQ